MIRDPRSELGSKKAFQVYGSTRKARITTSNPALLGCSASGGVAAKNPRSRAHYAHQGVDARSGDADESLNSEAFCHFRIWGSLVKGAAVEPKIGAETEEGKILLGPVRTHL